MPYEEPPPLSTFSSTETEPESAVAAPSPTAVAAASIAPLQSSLAAGEGVTSPSQATAAGVEASLSLQAPSPHSALGKRVWCASAGEPDELARAKRASLNATHNQMQPPQPQLPDLPPPLQPSPLIEPPDPPAPQPAPRLGQPERDATPAEDAAPAVPAGGEPAVLARECHDPRPLTRDCTCTKTSIDKECPALLGVGGFGISHWRIGATAASPSRSSCPVSARQRWMPRMPWRTKLSSFRRWTTGTSSSWAETSSSPSSLRSLSAARLTRSCTTTAAPPPTTAHLSLNGTLMVRAVKSTRHCSRASLTPHAYVRSQGPV